MTPDKPARGTSASERPLGRRLVAGASWAFLSKALTYPAGLILTMLLARLLSAEAMGGYFLATSLVAFAVAVVQLGMGRALVKLIAKALTESAHATVRQVVRIGVASVLGFASLVAAMLVTAFGDPLLGLLDGGEILKSSLLWISLLIVAMALVELFAEILRGFHDLRGTSLLIDQLLQRLILVSGLSVAWISGMQVNLENVLEYSFLAASVAVAVGIVLIRSNLAPLGHDGPRMAILDVYRLGPPFLVLRVNFWLLNMAGIWILGMFRPLEEVALYGAANMVASLVLASQTIVAGVGAPVIVELFHKQKMSLLQDIIRTAGFFGLIPAFLLTMLLLFFGETILLWIYGLQYQQAATMTVILAAGRCVAVACGVPAMTLAMTDHQITVMKVMTSMSALTLVAYFAFADEAGAIGVALITTISIAVQNLTMALLVKKRLGVLTFPTFSPRIWQAFVTQLRNRNRAPEQSE